MTIRPRDYQVAALDAFRAAYARGVRRPAIVHATGAGKTVTLSQLAREHLSTVGGRVLAVAHRTELIEQNAQELIDAAPELNVGIVKANRNETRADVISASVQTLAGESRRRMLADVSLVIIDECHRAAAKSYLDVLKHYGCYDSGARAAGFTATMVRGDDRALGDVWQEIVHTKDIASLVREGWLVRPRGLRVRVEDLDLASVKRSGGDYQADALGSAIEQSLAPEAIAKAMREHAPDRPTILFAPTVHSAGVIAEALREEGFTAAVVHAGTPADERRQVREDSRIGKVQIVCNALLYTEGTNWPWVSCIVIGRPTRSKGTFVQMAGRGLRTFPGKTDCLIMMIGGAAVGHSLLAPVELFGEAAEELERDPCSCVPGWQTPAGVDGGCRCGRRRCLDECPCGGGGADCGCPRPTGDELLESDDDIGDDLQEVFGVDGPIVAEEVDLFAGSDSAWDQTNGGVWFLPAGKERLIAIVPGDPAGRGGWDVVAMNAREAGSRWVVRGVSELAYAMAHAEGDITPAESSIARKEARWRRGRPSEAQTSLCGRLGLRLTGLETSGEVSRLIGKTFASRRIDSRVPAYARRQLINA